MSSLEVYEVFYEVAKRCGYQFSNYCNRDEFCYRETQLLWDLFLAAPDLVIEKYLNYEVSLSFLPHHFDYEAQIESLNTGLDEEEIKVKNFEKYYEKLLKVM